MDTSFQRLELTLKRPLLVPDELHRNHPKVHARGPEHTGSVLMELVVERLGLKDLSDVDVLDVGCGVRFTQALINRDIPIKSYTGVDVYRPLIDYLRREVDDPRFSFAHWDAHNAMYNATGTKLTSESSLPVAGTFDVIWLFSVFTHLEPADAAAMLTILRRHVRPGGHLFFSAFLDDAVDSFEDRIPEHPLENAYYSERSLRALIVAKGWSVASLHPKSPEQFIQHYFICGPTPPDATTSS